MSTEHWSKQFEGHTPGPWVSDWENVRNMCDEYDSTFHLKAHGKELLRIEEWGVESASEEDLELITFAPQLLKRVLELEHFLQDLVDGGGFVGAAAKLALEDKSWLEGEK